MIGYPSPTHPMETPKLDPIVDQQSPQITFLHLIMPEFISDQIRFKLQLDLKSNIPVWRTTAKIKNRRKSAKKSRAHSTQCSRRWGRQWQGSSAGEVGGRLQPWPGRGARAWATQLHAWKHGLSRAWCCTICILGAVVASRCDQLRPPEVVVVQVQLGVIHPFSSILRPLCLFVPLATWCWGLHLLSVGRCWAT